VPLERWTKKLMSKVAPRSKPVRRPARATRAAKKDKLPRGVQVSWWLTADIEVCAVCGEGYAYGSGYHCSGCDAAVCAFCVEDRGGEILCMEC
jgi:hypothetical protein